jgi:hypothetical protein
MVNYEDHGSGCAVCDQCRADDFGILSAIDKDEDAVFNHDDDFELSDDDRALQLLIEATSLYEDLMRGVMLAARADHIEKVAELTGVQPTILLYAFKHGTLRAHRHFLKKEYRSAKETQGDPPFQSMKEGEGVGGGQPQVHPPKESP